MCLSATPPGKERSAQFQLRVICNSVRQEQHGSRSSDVWTAKTLSQLAAFRLVVVCHQMCHLAPPTTSPGAHCPSGVILLLWWLLTPAASTCARTAGDFLVTASRWQVNRRP
jgi:hypothetical protein